MRCPPTTILRVVVRRRRPRRRAARTSRTRPGAYRQDPFRLILEEGYEEWCDWHLTHDPSGEFVGMGWTNAAGALGDFEAKHRWLPTAPESGFVQIAMAERRNATGIDVIRGLVLSRAGANARSCDPLVTRGDWFGALADTFHVRFEHSPQVHATGCGRESSGTTPGRRAAVRDMGDLRVRCSQIPTDHRLPSARHHGQRRRPDRRPFGRPVTDLGVATGCEWLHGRGKTR